MSEWKPIGGESVRDDVRGVNGTIVSISTYGLCVQLDDTGLLINDVLERFTPLTPLQPIESDDNDE